TLRTDAARMQRRQRGNYTLVLQAISTMKSGRGLVARRSSRGTSSVNFDRTSRSMSARQGSASRAALLVMGALVLLVGFVVFLTRGGETKAPIAGGDAVPAPSTARADLASSNGVEIASSADPRERSGAVPVGVRLRGPGHLEGRVIERQSGVGV